MNFQNLNITDSHLFNFQKIKTIEISELSISNCTFS